MKKKSYSRFILISIFIFGIIVGGTYAYPYVDNMLKPKGEFSEFSPHSKVSIYYFYDEKQGQTDNQKFTKLLTGFGKLYPNEIDIIPISSSDSMINYYKEELNVIGTPSLIIVNPKGYIIFNSKELIQKEQMQYILEPYL